MNQNICGNCCSVSDNPIGCYGPEMKEFLFNVHEPQFGGCPPGENFPQIIKEKAIIENANTTINDVIQEFSLLHRRGVDIGWLARWCVSEFYRRDNLSGVMGPPGELGQFAAEQHNDILLDYIPISAKVHLLNNSGKNRTYENPKVVREH